MDVMKNHDNYPVESKIRSLEAVVVINDETSTREAFLLSETGFEVKICDILGNDTDKEKSAQFTQSGKGGAQGNSDGSLSANSCLNGASVLTEERVEESNQRIFPLHVRRLQEIEMDAFHAGVIRRTCSLSRIFSKGFVRYVRSRYPESRCSCGLTIPVQDDNVIVTEKSNASICTKTMIVVKLQTLVDSWLDYKW